MRVTKEPEVRKQEILDTALKLFGENGYEKTSITDIAKAIGVAQGLCYRYFPSKEALFDSAIEQYADVLVEQFAGAEKEDHKTLRQIIEDNHIHNINNMQQLGGAEISGIKMHAAIDVVMRRNHIHHCTMGIWCDWEAQGTRLTQNLLHDNCPPEGTPKAEGAMMSQDIFIEVGHGPTLIDNNIMLSPVSVRMATDGVACVHNLMLGSLTAVGGGTGDRYTPYHIRHRTEVAGFMTFLHGDDRFYNNIFIQNYPVEETETVEDMGFKMEDNQEVGTHVFDEYPTYDEWISHFELDKPADMSKLEPYHNKCHLPVWVNGNAYFNGAKACVNEKENLMDNENQVKVELVEKDGHYSIKTNVYEFLKDFRTGIINSDILGYAFEPEQRFEDPDGSTIIFDQDYLGEHRGVAAMPGPFADGAEAEKILW